MIGTSEPWRVALLDKWRAEERAPFSGWDFSRLRGRLVEEQPPWSYDELSRSVLAESHGVLDMGTGGGEKLLELSDDLPCDTCATEGWPPNLALASRNLAARGISVSAYDAETDSQLPFRDARFDVVLNRHEAYDPAEVRRVLTPGGRFLTQQVDGSDLNECHEIFGTTARHADVNHDTFVAAARQAGLVVVTSGDWVGVTSYREVGALVYCLKAVPWEAPDDFCVDNYADALLSLHESGPAHGEAIRFTARRFYLIASKSA